MKNSAELKAEAKEALRGRWKDAVLMDLIPSLIQLAIVAIVMVPLAVMIMNNPNFANDPVAQDAAANNSGSSGGGIVASIIGFVFGSGILWTYLDIYRGKKTKISPLSDALRGWKSPNALPLIILGAVINIFITLWTLLLIIPGLVKSYSYRQAQFVYYDIYNETGEKPKTLDCITSSRNLMNGYKGQLFWLDLSFLGWTILAIATFGIGFLWLNPYIHATNAAFYNNLPKSRTEN